METCEICNYTLSIGKITSQDSTIVINDPSEFIKIMNKKKKDNITMSLELNFDISVLMSLIQKNGLKQEVSNYIIDNYNLIKKNSKPNTFCLRCDQCNETFVLKPGKLLSLKLRKNTNISNIINTSEIITDLTLPRTKDFICPNKDCKVKPNEKEAILYRPNPNEYITQYICVNCQTIF